MLNGRPRADYGLSGGGTAAVITDRAILRITDAGAVLASIHPGQTPEDVLARTPMPLIVPDSGPDETAAPTAVQQRLLRTELDPKGWYLG
jgi:acyl CoA:acetate/3-ketoacid CoA transferase beta subunit